MRRRFTPHVLAGLASAAVLAPIYLIALSALSAKSEVSAWPKAIWPRALSLETLSFFFGVRAVWTALGQSLIVAALTVAFATLLGAPAGYALARFRFAGKDTFRWRAADVNGDGRDDLIYVHSSNADNTIYTLLRKPDGTYIQNQQIVQGGLRRRAYI